MFSKSDLPDIAEREQAFELHRVFEELCEAFEEMLGVADPEAVRLARAKCDEAEEAYDTCGLNVLTDDKGNAIRCATSGAPILESDEIEIVLRVAIGLPPRNQEEKELLPDVEDVA